jgi:hypothetical protein
MHPLYKILHPGQPVLARQHPAETLEEIVAVPSSTYGNAIFEAARTPTRIARSDSAAHFRQRFMQSSMQYLDPSSGEQVVARLCGEICATH